MKFLSQPKYQLYLTLLVIALIYWFTKPPSILWIDSGTMIAASASLGIPNPPGFPFYMMASHVFGNIFFFLSKREAQQLFSIVFATGLLYFVYKIIRLLIEQNLREKIINLSHFSALFGMIALAFSYEFWSQSQNTEAFIPTYFFVTLFAFLLLSYLGNLSHLSDLKETKASFFKTLALIAFLYGLAAGMNPTAAALVPGTLYVMFLNRKYLTLSRLSILGILFLITLIAVYSYLPIRASQWPFVNWGNPQTWELFWGHLKGHGLDIYEPKSNSINGFTGSPIIFGQSVTYFFLNSLLQFTPFLVPFILFGMVKVFKENRKLFTFLISVPLIDVFYSGIYYSGNQEAWFILAWIFFAVFMGIGFYWVLIKYLKLLKSPKLLKFIFLLCLLPLITWFWMLNRSGHFYSSDYAYNLYAPLEKNAIIVGTGDFFDSLSHYLHVADKFREDVTPVTANVFYVNRWNRDALRHSTNLSVSDRIEEIIQYRKYSEYNDAMNLFFEENIDKHPIYVDHLTLRASALAATSGGQLRLDPARFKFLPYGLSLKVVRADDKSTPDLSLYDFKINSPLKPGPSYLERNYRGAYTNIINNYVYAYEYLADWFAENGNDEEAKKYYRKALDLTDNNGEVYAHLGAFYAIRKDFNASMHYFQKAERLDVTNVSIHFNLGVTYANLGKVDEARLEFESVRRLSDLGDPVVQEAERILASLPAQSSPSNPSNPSLVDTSSWTLIQDAQNNFSIKVPSGFKRQNPEGSKYVMINNGEIGVQALNLEIYGEKLNPGDNIEEKLKNSPLLMTGMLLDTQNFNVPGFNAAVQIYGTQTGESSQRFILVKDNRYWQIKVAPGNSVRLQDFYAILGTFKSLE